MLLFTSTRYPIKQAKKPKLLLVQAFNLFNLTAKTPLTLLSNELFLFLGEIINGTIKKNGIRYYVKSLFCV